MIADASSPDSPASHRLDSPTDDLSSGRAQEGHFIPTGVSLMQLTQMGLPHELQRTRVASLGWFTQKSRVSSMCRG